MKTIIITVSKGALEFHYADPGIRLIVLDYDNGQLINPKELTKALEIKAIDHSTFIKDHTGEIAEVEVYEDNEPIKPGLKALAIAIDNHIKELQ